MPLARNCRGASSPNFLVVQHRIGRTLCAPDPWARIAANARGLDGTTANYIPRESDGGRSDGRLRIHSPSTPAQSGRSTVARRMRALCDFSVRIDGLSQPLAARQWDGAGQSHGLPRVVTSCLDRDRH